YASHSRHIEPLRDHLITRLDGITPQPASIPLYSTLTTQPIDPAELTAEYWYRNLREPVQFQPTISALGEAGHHTYLEISPHPVLTTAIQDTLEHTQQDNTPPTLITGTLRRDHTHHTELLTTLAKLHTHGHQVNWGIASGTDQSSYVDLPTYPFQRE